MTSCPVDNHEKFNLKSRLLSNTEHSWCRAVSSGTGNTVLALQVAKSPSSELISFLHNKLHKLQNAHLILSSKLHYNPISKQFSFLTSNSTPQVKINFHDSSSTSQILHTLISINQNSCDTISPFQLLLEHELNKNNWFDPNSFSCNVGVEVFFASVYALSETKAMVVLRLHAAICDRTTGVSLLRELMDESNAGNGGETNKGIRNEGEGFNMGIESLIPKGMAKKTIWTRGMNKLKYSVNSFRLTNLKFMNVKNPRFSEVVSLQINSRHTARILDGCKTRKIKVCGALAAAGLMAVHSTKLQADDQLKKKYGVVTLIDCRSDLEPPLSSHHFGFYQSAILNIHTVKGDENFWDLAQRIYMNFADDKKCNKHLTDIADINFLMCKAIDNPSLTASSSLRTSFISVFEDPLFDDSGKLQQELGVECYMGCASTHGIGPSIAIFDTIRDGELDCVCVYPSPLHSRAQMNELFDHMRRVLIEESDIWD